MIPDEYFPAKSILIAGGTGSLGNHLVDRLLQYPIKRIVVFSRDEEKQLDMQGRIADTRVQYEIGNVRDYERLCEVLTNIDVVYHASALKIITVCEEYPEEAIKTNLQGTINMRKACLMNGVSKAIFISTDKAVKPVNAYGMTKALAEKVWLSKHTGNTAFSVVRYGNVIRSRGSVIPFFEKLKKEGKPFTITHKDMTRFLITLDKAISLIFTATLAGKNREIFVPEIPACYIVDLAHALGGEDYPIKYVGVRVGEKIDEVLVHEEEMRRTSTMGGYFVIRPENPDTSGAIFTEYTSSRTEILDIQQIKELLQEAHQ